MRKLTSMLGIILILLFVFSTPAVAATPEKLDVLIRFDRIPGPSEEGLVHAFGGEIKYAYNIVPAIAASIPEEAIQGLSRNPRVIGIEPNIVFQAIGDGEYPWGVLQIGADIVHASGNEGSGVKVAVIDTGIDYRHPELKAAYAGGYDFVNGDPNPMDDNGHGTHVAGTIAAALNGSGVVGVAPDVELYALKVLDSNGTGYLDDIIEALDWACGNNPQNIVVQITNNSYGSPVDDELGLMQLAFDLSYSNPIENWGLLHVASAGNGGIEDVTADNVGYPAKYDSVIAVAAIDQENNRAYFPSIERYSSTGPAVELAAPGVDILSTYLHRSYAWGSGTSMASPHVAGTAALVMASPETTARDANNNGIYETNGDGVWSNIEVRALLQATADDLGTAGKDNIYGYGLVDADEAALPSGPINNSPTVSINTPADGATFNSGEVITFEGTASDIEDGDQTASLVWTSDKDGQVGTGGSFSAILSDGYHTITASVADSGGKTGNDSINITVGPPPQGITVTGISPGTMSAGTTIEVTIEGSGFTDGAVVSFENGTGPAPEASVLEVSADGTIIKASITAKSGGPPRDRVWDVRVTNPDSSSGVLASGFTVTP